MVRCEDFPCCGHEPGDCDGSLYGSDEQIKARVVEVLAMQREYGLTDEEADRMMSGGDW